MRRVRTIGLVVLAVVLLGVIARLVAPHYILQYVNRTLDGLDGYSGHVADVDLQIWRGAYSIEGVRITKDGAEKPIPFVSARRIDISVQWAALLDGSIVGELDLFDPSLNMVADKRSEPKAEDQREKREAAKAVKGESSWQTQVKDLVPLKINRIGIHDGAVHYRDPFAEPKVDVYVKQLNGRVTNLTNSEELSESLAADASFEGVAMGSGKLKIDGRIDPYQQLPTFHLTAQLEALEIKELNDFLRAYVNVDAEAGTLSVYTEADAAKGRFNGYVKPLVRDLRIIDWRKESEGPLHKVWEALVEGVTELFENHREEQVATRIPFSGKVQQPDADVPTTVIYVLRNAFIRALSSGLDQKLGLDGRSAKKND